MGTLGDIYVRKDNTFLFEINAAILMSYQLFIFMFCNLAAMVRRVGNIQSKGYLEICHSLDLHYEE